MELTTSLRVPAINISGHCKAYSYHINRLIPTKPTTKNIKKYSNFPLKCSANKLIQPIGLSGDSRFPKSLLFSQPRPNSIRAFANGSDTVLHKGQLESYDPNMVFSKISHFGSTCYKFLRPYAMLQAIVASTSFFARVLVENPQFLKWSLLLEAFPGLIAVILAHVYFHGINQVFDADIDRVNKPHLPIPAGDLSLKQAWFFMISSVLVGQSILWLMKADLITTCLYWSFLILSTMYSAPPIRFKRSSLATIILISLKAFINNVGVIYATMVSLGLPFRLSPPFVFILTFNTLFFVVANIIKDIEDVEGDMKHNIRTFAATFGPKNMVFLGTGILLLNFIGAIATSIYMPQAFKRHVMLPAHLIPALQLFFQARKLDKQNYSKEASANFYQFLWKLLTLEFLSFPFM